MRTVYSCSYRDKGEASAILVSDDNRVALPLGTVTVPSRQPKRESAM